ncbi:efflux RND transporter periplasmic adaptor subunit, partial [Burkholderia gladioli]
VPQNYAPSVRPGTDATLTVPEYPQRKFVAKVVAASGAVNPQSGTTLVQLVVDNRDGALLPGAFANLAFALPASADTLRVPASSILFDAQGTRVMTVGADG